MKKSKKFIAVFAVLIFTCCITAVSRGADQPETQSIADYEMIPVRYIDESELGAVAASVTQLLGLEPSQIQPFGKFLAVKADEETLKDIKAFLKTKDRLPKHIIFEAIIIQVNIDKVRDVGAKITADYAKVADTKSRVVDVDTDYGITGAFTHAAVWTFNQGANVFKLTTGYILENGIGKVISKPVVRVKEGNSAEFKDVILIPFVTVSQNGTNVQYEETGINITVQNAVVIPSPTPHLSKDDENYVPDLIKADFIVKDGSPGKDLGGGLTTINQTAVTSNGLFKDGEVFMAASIVREIDTIRVYRVPLFSRVPLLGKMFRTKENSRDNSEIIVLIRPRIERDLDQQFLVPWFADNHEFLPKEVGEKVGLKGVPEIYDIERCKDGSYFALVDHYTHEDIQKLGEMFKSILGRVEQIPGMAHQVFVNQIKHDSGLEAAMEEQLQAFQKETGKRKPTLSEFVIAAAHTGVIGREEYLAYVERLNIVRACSKK
ncbi:MAG: hypothetical protein ABIH66_11730 [bacterium]